MNPGDDQPLGGPEPPRRFILEAEPVSSPSVFDQPTGPMPFVTSAGPPGPGSLTPLEQLLERAYRWRSVLGIGLAGLMTVAVVVAYRGATSDDRLALVTDNSDRSGSAFAGIADFEGAQSAESDSRVIGGDQKVSSAVDENTTASRGPGSSSSSAPRFLVA